MQINRHVLTFPLPFPLALCKRNQKEGTRAQKKKVNIIAMLERNSIITVGVEENESKIYCTRMLRKHMDLILDRNWRHISFSLFPCEILLQLGLSRKLGLTTLLHSLTTAWRGEHSCEGRSKQRVYRGL